ncbi:palmitoyltransferase [Corchorus olitorius]|uniref:Palmitoyltransferase n=1 Tax=Corchorus olitorius TaxID=93759 RepID=A0A1R3KRX6_9ROSI|nr:palmitoyltransferase [Corchorus olitorius]
MPNLLYIAKRCLSFMQGECCMPLMFSACSNAYGIVHPMICCADQIWEPNMQTEDANSTSAPNVARDIDTVDCGGGKERKKKLNRSGKFWTEMTSNELMAISKRVMRQTAKCTR